MSMLQQINHAFCKELARENRPLPVTYQEAMGTTYNYNTDTIAIFLAGVAKWLAADIPPYVFDDQSLSAAKCVKARVVDLEGMIASKTAPKT